jgi:hypothetical protein
MIKPYEYIVEKEVFDRRTLTQLQHKLRVALKCYTITNFKMSDQNESPNNFEFKITYRKNKIQFGEDKYHHGSYSKEDIGDLKYKITIYVYD